MASSLLWQRCRVTYLLFTNHGSARSATSWSVSTFHLIVRLVFILASGMTQIWPFVQIVSPALDNWVIPLCPRMDRKKLWGATLIHINVQNDLKAIKRCEVFRVHSINSLFCYKSDTFKTNFLLGFPCMTLNTYLYIHAPFMYHALRARVIGIARLAWAWHII